MHCIQVCRGASVAWRGMRYIYIYIYTVRRLEVETNAVLHCVAWRGARACVCVCERVAALLLEVESNVVSTTPRQVPTVAVQ